MCKNRVQPYSLPSRQTNITNKTQRDELLKGGRTCIMPCTVKRELPCQRRCITTKPIFKKERHRKHTVFISIPSSNFSITLLIPFSKNVHLNRISPDVPRVLYWRPRTGAFLISKLTFHQGHPCEVSEALTKASCLSGKRGVFVCA